MRRKLPWALGALIAITLSLLFVFYPIEPSGKYAEPHIGSDGLAFLELTNGQARLVVPRGVKSSAGFLIKYLATYKQMGNKWILEYDDGTQLEFKATLLRINIDQPNHRPWVLYRMKIYALATRDFEALKY